jgi:undecaprenyl diphosphate synthase
MTTAKPISTTQVIPDFSGIPQHLAVIMDGNGRWAKSRGLPRVSGHVQGVESVRTLTEQCGRHGIQYLTLFAFSSENWRRPAEEVGFLMKLLLAALGREVKKLHAAKVRLRVVGDLTALPSDIQAMIHKAHALTQVNTALNLTVALNYGGRWDITQAAKRAAAELPSDQIDEAALKSRLCMSFAPEVDLLVRTGGESRISNFLLWDLAYAELHFTPILWPEFDADALQASLDWYVQRERRFGRTSEQVTEAKKTKA